MEIDVVRRTDGVTEARYAPSGAWLRYLNDLDAYVATLEALPVYEEDDEP